MELVMMMVEGKKVDMVVLGYGNFLQFGAEKCQPLYSWSPSFDFLLLVFQVPAMADDGGADQS